MKIVRDKQYWTVVFEGKVLCKSHIRLDCEQFIFAKIMERRWK